MGTTISVASTVYNLSGDVSKRVNFVKTAVAGAIITKSSIPQTITDSYLRGPGITYRNFARWSREKGYINEVGMVVGTFSNASSINSEVIKDYLPTLADHTISVVSARIGPAEFYQWAEQYMRKEEPDLVNTNWTADYTRSTNIITITLQGGGTIVFSPVDLVPNSKYLYVEYSHVSATKITTPVNGPITVGPFPVLQGSSVLTESLMPHQITLSTNVQTQVTYSDNRQGTFNEYNTTFLATVDDFDRTLVKAQKTSETTYTDTLYYLVQRGSARNNAPTTQSYSGTFTDSTQTPPVQVTQTTTITTTTQSVGYYRQWQTATQQRTIGITKPVQTHIYRRFSYLFAAMENMFTADANTVGRFFPYIPVRIDNKFISDEYLPVLYNASQKAYRKATGGKLTKLIDSLKDNPSLGDIDYAYVIFGVPLNARENEGRVYLYKFFEACILNSLGNTEYQNWLAYENNRQVLIAEQAAFEAEQIATGSQKYLVYDYETGGSQYVFPMQEPIPPYVAPPTSVITITSGNLPVLNYDITISWNFMDIDVGTGLLKPNAYVGELWFTDETPPPVVIEENSGEGGPYTYTVPQPYVLCLNYQIGPNQWKKIRVGGLRHSNNIYGGKRVDITVAEAMADDDESGFIVPLHEDIFHDTRLVPRTQMANSCSYMMLNSYVVKKKKWYQSGIFAIIVVIVIVIVSIYYPPASAALSSGGGILGGNVAVGTALGFTATAAVIAGAIANAIAAMIVMQLITAGATALLGTKVGSIVGFIASIVALNVGTAYMAGSNAAFSMSAAFGNMMSAENLMKLTMSVGNGITSYLQASSQEMQGKTAELLEEFQKQSKAISDATDNEFGSNIIDIQAIMEAATAQLEPPSVFLSRTTLTGTDIAEMSMQMISEFTRLTLDLSLPT